MWLFPIPLNWFGPSGRRLHFLSYLIRQFLESEECTSSGIPIYKTWFKKRHECCEVNGNYIDRDVTEVLEQLTYNFGV